MKARMKRAIRQWMGGQDYHHPDEPVSSFKGVLSYRGLPTGLCYYSLVTGRRHQIISEDADARVRRFLKNREFVEHANIKALIDAVHENPRALSPVGTDALVLRHINTINSLMKAIGSPRPFRSGDEYISAERTMDWEPNKNRDMQNELTVLLYRLQTEGTEPFPYLVKSLHPRDTETMRGTAGWRPLGSDWFATRDLMEFTLFKIGRVKSLPLEISYAGG